MKQKKIKPLGKPAGKPIDSPQNMIPAILILVAALVMVNLIYLWQLIKMEQIMNQMMVSMKTLEWQLSQWQDDAISPYRGERAEPEEWQAYIDDDLGFQIDIPADWYVRPQNEELVGFSPSGFGDYVWGVHIYNSSEITTQAIINDMGKQFEQTRQESRRAVIINGLSATNVLVTTTTHPDWFYQAVIIEYNDKIFQITNGAIRDDRFGTFYQSFKLLGQE